MPKVWKVAPKISDDPIEQLLHNRGIKIEEEKEKFLHPRLEDYKEDLKIPGISQAKKRVEEAIKSGELIIVYGDYDVDGICGAAVLYLGLTALGAKVLPYIPHREKEGYGLSKEGLQSAKEKGAGLVITVDNGIVALEQAKIAKSLGLDLIITDHHQPVEKKPEVLAVVHSTKMCGTAIGWCLVRELVGKEKSEELLDLVAVATICDLLPLLDINRALVKVGLQKLNCTKRPGLLALFLESKILPGEIAAYQVGHILGPRLNAIGRLEHAIDALRLLCTKDMEKARNLARLLCQANDQKKLLTNEAILQAKEAVSGDKDLPKKKILVLHSHKWIPGIIGLVAARIAEEYHFPTIVIAEGEGFSKGSARSVEGVDIIAQLRKCCDFLEDVGGHPKAAGFTIATDKIEEFKKELDKNGEFIKINHDDELIIEAEVPAKKLTKKLVEELNIFEPTGPENIQPVLATMNIKVTDLRVLSEGQHLKFKADGIDAIAFSFGHLRNFLQEGQLVDVAYYLEINKFNGYENLQLKVLDIQY